ncbi:hypothetical protein V8J85_16985 [Yoonia sp. 2307UL14-13]
MRFLLWTAVFVAWFAPASADLQADAEAALTAGRSAEVIDITDEILADIPVDFPALFVKAAALSDLGRFGDAAQTAGAAFRAAQNDAERLQAARLASSAHFRARQYARAEWWLRRASNHVNTPEEAANVFTEFQAVRRENPLGVRLNFGVAPSNNINGGAESEVFRLEGLDFDLFLPPEQVALSGIEYSGDVQLSYRLSRSATQATRLGVFLYGRTYTPSDSAKDSVPGISGSDYSLALLDISLAQRRLIFPQVGPTILSGHIGQVWFGGDAFWQYGKIGVGQDFMIGDGSAITLQAAVEDQRGIAGRQADTRITSIATGYRATLANRDQMQVILNCQLYDTDAFESSFEDYSIVFDYRLARPVFGINWGGFLGAGQTTYDDFFLSLDGRRDEYVFGGGSATWTDISYFGFSPRVDLTAERRRSDVDQFSASSLQVRFGLESNF